MLVWNLQKAHEHDGKHVIERGSGETETPASKTLALLNRETLLAPVNSRQFKMLKRRLSFSPLVIAR